MADVSRPFSVATDLRAHRKMVTISLQSRSNSSAKYMKKPKERTARSDSVIALEELVQCGICQDQLSLSRMLPCQHTFCLTCLQEQVLRTLPKVGGPNQVQQRRQPIVFTCALCRQPCELPEGVDSLTDLPPNMYIENLLAALAIGAGGGAPADKQQQQTGASTSPTATTTPAEEKQINCAKCRIVCVIQEQQYQKCLHCKQPFCNVCWSDHVADLEAKLTNLSQQLQDSQSRIQYKQHDLAVICGKLEDTIRATTEAKIVELRKREADALGEVGRYRGNMAGSSKELEVRVIDLVDEIERSLASKGKGGATPTVRVAVYVKQHRATSKLMDEITHWGEARPIFNPSTFQIEQTNEKFSEEATSENQQSPLGTAENHYKQCQFQCVLTWEKCPRPGAIRMAPWDVDLLFIAGNENESVMIFNVAREKLVGKLVAPEMRCPAAIAFSDKRQQIYVADKWTSKIYVFTADGEFKGIFMTNYQFRNPQGISIVNESQMMICDTGNDRAVILDLDSGNLVGFIGYDPQLDRTSLNTPTDIATTDSGDIVIVDSGNQRIQVFDPTTFKRRLEFGSMGRQRGQFVFPAAAHLDGGHVLVGDGGSGRLQVFDLETGQLVRMFDHKGGFKSVTGLAVRGTQVIVTDNIGKKLHVFETARVRNRNI